MSTPKPPADAGAPALSDEIKLREALANLTLWALVVTNNQPRGQKTITWTEPIAEIEAAKHALQQRRAQPAPPLAPSVEQVEALREFVLSALNAVGNVVSIQEAGDAVEREFDAVIALYRGEAPQQETK